MIQNKLAPLVIITGASAFLAIYFHLPYVNGFPGVWMWKWKDASLLFHALVMAPSLMLALGGLRLAALEKNIAAPLIFFALALLYSQVAGTYLFAGDISFIKQVVQSHHATGYFTDAAKIVDLGQFLETFHRQKLTLHSTTHPAGPIIFYYIAISIFGPETGAYVGGALIGFVAALGVFMVYLLAGLWTEKPLPRLVACGLYSLLPGLVVFFPTFDQVYPVLAMMMIYLWRRSFDKPWVGAALGTVLFLMLFFAYNLLVIGAIMVMMAAAWILGAEDQSRARERIIVAGAVAVGVWAASFLLLNLLSGYDPALAFQNALRAQRKILTFVPRPYFPSLMYNITDFALGAGYMAIVLFAAAVWKALKDQKPTLDANAMTIICAAQLLIVNFSGLLPGETARVWLFMQPLVIIPAGLALARFPWPWLAAVFTLQWLVMMAVRANLTFIILW